MRRAAWLKLGLALSPALLLILLALTGCGHILRSVTGEDTPHCKPKCAKTEVCRFDWTGCGGPFGESCSHSETTACRPKP